MRIILLGAPGAGKGTQAEFICNRLNIPRISTGDMLRAHIAANTEIGQSVKAIMAQGLLVPEQIVIKMINERTSQADCSNGYLLDGFPRTLAQAEALEKAGTEFDAVIEIRVPDDEIIRRLSGRRFHVPSGRTYHISAHPPKIPNQDDITGEPLIQRDDDKEETVGKRLEVYHQQTEPLIQWFKSRPKYHFASIPGIGSIDQIHQLVEEAIILKPSERGAGRA